MIRIRASKPQSPYNMRVSIGSTNPRKVAAVEKAFELRFKEKIDSCQHKVSSGVSDQPFGDETIEGAINRAKMALKAAPKADYGVGLEGGITYIRQLPFQIAWCAIVNKKGEIGLGSSFGVQMPPKIIKKVNQGKELGDVLDEVFNENNIKQKEGFFGLATGNEVTREKGYQDMVLSALYRFTTNDFKDE